MANFSVFRKKLTTNIHTSTSNKILSKKLLTLAIMAMSANTLLLPASAFAASAESFTNPIAIDSSIAVFDPVLRPASISAKSMSATKIDTLKQQEPQVGSSLALDIVQPDPIQTDRAEAGKEIAEIASAPAKPFAISSAPGTSYPWANAPFPNSIPDSWGMYQRQCVSYAAWKVSSSGRVMPNWAGRGDANLWDDNARSAGIPVDTSPRVGDIAVDNSGGYGHVMYVEAVNADGTIHISQYNARWDGEYSEETNRSTAGLQFIHF